MTEPQPAQLDDELVRVLGLLDKAPRGIPELTIASLDYGSRTTLEAYRLITSEKREDNTLEVMITPLGKDVIRRCSENLPTLEGSELAAAIEEAQDLLSLASQAACVPSTPRHPSTPFPTTGAPPKKELLLCGKPTVQAGTDGFCTLPKGHDGACVESSHPTNPRGVNEGKPARQDELAELRAKVDDLTFLVGIVGPKLLDLGPTLLGFAPPPLVRPARAVLLAERKALRAEVERLTGDKEWLNRELDRIKAERNRLWREALERRAEHRGLGVPHPGDDPGVPFEGEN